MIQLYSTRVISPIGLSRTIVHEKVKILKMSRSGGAGSSIAEKGRILKMFHSSNYIEQTHHINSSRFKFHNTPYYSNNDNHFPRKKPHECGAKNIESFIIRLISLLIHLYSIFLLKAAYHH